jgi:hypothetical protein
MEILLVENLVAVPESSLGDTETLVLTTTPAGDRTFPPGEARLVRDGRDSGRL